MNKLMLILIQVVILTACASRPVLYPNEKYKSVGKDGAVIDIDKCMDDGDKFIQSSKGKQILKSAGEGAFVGGLMGAVFGLITGDFVKTAATGAAVGGVGGAAGGAITPNKLKRRYTNMCLQKKGYQILGWD